MKRKDIDKLQKAENTAMRRILKALKVGCTGSNKRRDRNKQHEGKNSKAQASASISKNGRKGK